MNDKLVVQKQPAGDKLVKDGKVAVLISYGFGAGWSTWSSGSVAQEMVFDADIAQLVLDKADYDAIESVAEKKWPGKYFGGIKGLEVEWLTPGTAFEVSEYDGAENLRILGDISYYVA